MITKSIYYNNLTQGFQNQQSGVQFSEVLSKISFLNLIQWQNYLNYLSELFVTTNKASAIASRVTFEHQECVIPRYCVSFYKQLWFKTVEETNVIPQILY